MRRIRVYADTSVFGGTQDEEFSDASMWLFEKAKQGAWVILISQITLDELLGAPDSVRSVLEDLPPDAVEEVAVDDEVRALADAYVAAGALGPARRNDARHIAAATVAGADAILSWNFRHVVNFERIRKYNGVNVLNGYHPVAIHSPLEMGYEDEKQDI